MFEKYSFTSIQRELQSNHNLLPVIGVELEFYLLDARTRRPRILTDRELISFTGIMTRYLKLESVHHFSAETAILCPPIQTEKGRGQYEICTPPIPNLENLTTIINVYIKVILFAARRMEAIYADFGPKPIIDDYGSGAHYHISLHDFYTKKNAFADNSWDKNNLLKHSIAGILHYLQRSFHWLCGENESEYTRFKPGFMAPMNASWGLNNRSTAVRVLNFNPENRRIEFRAPSGNIDASKVIFFLLASIERGIAERLEPPAQVYGNASDDAYHTDPKFHFGAFPSSVLEARNRHDISWFPKFE